MKRAIMGLAAVIWVAGCGMEGQIKPDVDDTKGLAEGKAEAWGSSDSPTLFNSSLEYRIASLPQTGQATNIPWPSSYWPTYEDSINYRWEGAGTDSPAKKYERAYGLTGVEDAVSQNYGVDAYRSRTACTTDSQCNSKIGESCAKRYGATSGYCIPTWWGICHAWAPAAILAPEPKYPVTVNGVTLKVNDIKALVTLVHNSVSTKFISLRCNSDAASNEITFDAYGRPTGSDCRDTNAGSWHVIMTNYLGIQKASFVFDRTYDDEVWNQPLRGYRVTQQKEVTASEANRLIGVTSAGGTTQARSGTVAKDAWAHQGSFPVAAGQAFKVVMTGTGDADLYVKFGAQPTASAYDCRPYAGSSTETCELTVPAGATQAFVSVIGYAATSTFNLTLTSGGSTPTSYQFNANAVKFFHIKADVDFITESSSSTDGNLASRIDSYTGAEHYEYIVEVDSAGKIIGGEWIGSSKTRHPDFLWLPTGVNNTSHASGKITYARVKELLDKSLTPPGGGGSTGTQKTVNASGTLAKGAWKQYGPFNVASGATLKAVMTGDGDADLYVRKGSAPTASSYDCRPYKSGSAEECSVVGPGAIYVGVNGYATSSNFQLVITYVEGTGTTPPVDPPATITHLNVTDSVTLNGEKRYTLAVPAGAKIVIRTTAPSDIDLYIQMNQAPTVDSYLARAWTTSGNETLTYTATSNGTLHIMVHGYAASTFTLTTSSN